MINLLQVLNQQSECDASEKETLREILQVKSYEKKCSCGYGILSITELIVLILL